MKNVAPAEVAKQVDALGLWFALGLLASVLVSGVVSTVFLVNTTFYWVDHTHRVIESLGDVATNLSASTNARRGFSLTGNSEQQERFVEAAQELTAAVQRVRTLTADNPVQQRRLDELEPLIAQRIAWLSTLIEARRTLGFELEREANQTRIGAQALGDIVRRVADLAAEERRLLVEREMRMRTSLLRTEILEGTGAMVSLLLIAIVAMRLRRETRRRERSENAVRESERAIQLLNADLERRVQERTAQLQMANRELESFSHSVIHDLRAPLRGMGGFAELLLSDSKDTLSADAQDSLREIKQNARTMAALIDALVSMSRITRTELQKIDLDLTKLARAVENKLTAAEPRPLLGFSVQENLRANIDPQLARTLIEILLGNAWKFTNKVAAARIEFGSEETAGEHVFFIKDNGAGFNLAHQAKLFAPFGRLHTVGEFPGIGIGLASAQRIVERHGGRIWADGHVGAGATFFFTLGPQLPAEMS